jgi:hypothetical protein
MLALTPLAGPECRWAVARQWVFVVRWISTLLIFGVVLVASWYCWFTSQLDPTYRPGSAIRISLVIAVSLNLSFVLLLTPAVLAGAFAGDPARGSLGLLLSTRVSAGEIVLSRFISRLCQVAMVAASGLPGLCLLAAYGGIGVQSLAMLMLLTTAVAAGGAGLALSISVMFRRARDSLIGTYAIGLSLLMIPVLGSPWFSSALAPWCEALNPFWCLGPLIEYGRFEPAWRSIVVWSAMAPIGILTTRCLLRPAYLRRVGGKVGAVQRRGHVPPLGDCPILWKELYIEADKDFGRLAKIIGWLVLSVLMGSSALLLALHIWSLWTSETPELVEATLTAAAPWIATLSLPMGWLVQWAVGIRAAAGIASEKEQGTWDALMMTPLEGRQIVRAKMMESFYSLRWFLAATLSVWVLGTLLGGMGFLELLSLATYTAAQVGLMSAAGVWSSLFASTTGRAITITLAIWLIGKILLKVAACLLVLVAMLVQYLIWTVLQVAQGKSTASMPQPLMSFETAITLFEVALCTGTALAVAWYCHIRFDTHAGRCPERPIPVRIRPT